MGQLLNGVTCRNLEQRRLWLPALHIRKCYNRISCPWVAMNRLHDDPEFDGNPLLIAADQCFAVRARFLTIAVAGTMGIEALDHFEAQVFVLAFGPIFPALFTAGTLSTSVAFVMLPVPMFTVPGTSAAAR